jgi:DNA-binding transcriptional LysR family regulator
MDRVASMTAFAAVVSSGSFSAAAKRLNLSPATVTNHVQALEERLGARLLNRTTRKLSLTEAGHEYYDRCAQILAQIEEADNHVSALQAAPRGTLKINAATILASGLASLIGAFGAAYPEITVELFTSDRMVDLVEEGFDMAIRFNHARDSSLIVRRLGQFRVVACGAPAYFAARGIPREPADLHEHNCLAYTYPGFTALTREWQLIGPRGRTTVPISGNFHSNSAESIRAAAYEGRGVIMAPTYIVYEAICARRLVHVLPDYHLGEFPINALYPHRQHVSAKLRAFLDFAARHFAEDPKWQPRNCQEERIAV